MVSLLLIQYDIQRVFVSGVSVSKRLMGKPSEMAVNAVLVIILCYIVNRNVRSCLSLAKNIKRNVVPDHSCINASLDTRIDKNSSPSVARLGGVATCGW